MLPDSRDLTLIPQVSTLPSSTGNALQDQTIIARRALSGGDLLIIDDFSGSAIDTAKWGTIGPGATIANGGLQLLPDRVGGHVDAYVETAGLGIGNLPFRCSAIVNGVFAYSLSLPHNAGLDFGITDGPFATRTDPNSIYFEGRFGENWSCIVGPTTFPTTVPCVNAGANAPPQLLEIWRDATGVVTFLIDGVPVVQTASSGAFLATSGLVVDGWHTLTGAASNTNPMVFDSAKIWVQRYPVSPTSGPPSPTPHFESGHVTFDGVTNGPDGTTRTRRVNFLAAFGNPAVNLFKYFVTLGPGNVRTLATVSLIDGALAAFMDIRVEDATFVGPVSWQAYL